MSDIVRAKRPFFVAKNADKDGCIYYEKEVEFDWHRGVSWQVRQRSSMAMAQEIKKMYPNNKIKILEVSTKSSNYELGIALSIMNLMYTDFETQNKHSIETGFKLQRSFQDKERYSGLIRNCSLLIQKVRSAF